ncbi:MAG: Na/Pi symporter [Lachnospiraceae bacterium]
MTGVIQSSAATTVMLVGFVNAGIMKFAQTVPVIMGANIGTTVTGQILRLGVFSGSQLIFELIKPDELCSHRHCHRLFHDPDQQAPENTGRGQPAHRLWYPVFGMTTMESALSPLKDSAAFQEVFFMFKNPLLGVLLGAVVTAILQSSSASVGISSRPSPPREPLLFPWLPPSSSDRTSVNA